MTCGHKYNVDRPNQNLTKFISLCVWLWLYVHYAIEQNPYCFTISRSYLIFSRCVLCMTMYRKLNVASMYAMLVSIHSAPTLLLSAPSLILIFLFRWLRLWYVSIDASNALLDRNWWMNELYAENRENLHTDMRRWNKELNMEWILKWRNFLWLFLAFLLNWAQFGLATHTHFYCTMPFHRFVVFSSSVLPLLSVTFPTIYSTCMYHIHSYIRASFIL